MADQPKALRLAEQLETVGIRFLGAVAEELRRQDMENAALHERHSSDNREYMRVLAQRDELLAAAKEAEPLLQAMLNNIRNTLPQYQKMPALDNLRAAISRAEDLSNT